MHKAMEVCTVCGSFLIVGDIQSRLDEHTSGKQHAGYAKIRASLEKLLVRFCQVYFHISMFDVILATEK
jgi:hypothetical protein